MKLTQLEYFCVAARYHNITRASKELFVTQPSVSNAIKALEEEFGVNLFYRKIHIRQVNGSKHWRDSDADRCNLLTEFV